MRNKLKLLGCVSLAFVLILTTMSCSYKKFTLREGYSHFSFSYPANYENILLDLVGEYTHVAFIRSMLEEQWGDSWINVYVREPDSQSGIVDAKSSIEYDIANFSESDNFQLLERTSVTVAGIKAEKFICSFTRYPLWEQADDVKDIKETSTFIYWEVKFDFNGLIWDIHMGSIEKTAESDKEIFDHLIESFKILK